MSFIYNLSTFFNAPTTVFNGIALDVSNGAGGAPSYANGSFSLNLKNNGSSVFGVTPLGRTIIGDVANQVAQAAVAGVSPDSTGILTVLTNLGPSAGFAALKIGVGTAAAAGWFTNPAVTHSVALYATIESSSTRNTGIFCANFTSIVLPGVGNDSAGTTLEIDINNNNTVQNGIDNPLSKNGITIVSGGTTSPTTAILVSPAGAGANGNMFFLAGGIMTRANKGWYFTQRVGDLYDSFNEGCIVDDSDSIATMRIIGGTHTYGIDFTGGTFTTKQIKGIGFSIDPNGNIDMQAGNSLSWASGVVAITHSTDALAIGGSTGARFYFHAPVAAFSSMNLPQGTAPTSPQDGDVWREDNTNTGLKVRINSTTKTIVVA